MRRITWALFATMLLAATVAAPASAKVDRIPVSSAGSLTGVVSDPGYWWVSGNVTHQRDQSFEMRVDGIGAVGNEYMDGYLVFDSFNTNINCLTGIGNLWAEFTWTVDLDENSGWIGTSTGHYSGNTCSWPPDYLGTLESKIVATGFGQFEGLQYRADDVRAWDDEGIPYHHSEGYVMIPG